jgi:hypothetical protein
MSDTIDTRDDFETREDAGTGDRGLVRLWLSAWTTAGKEEESWRSEAESTVKRYRQEETAYGFDPSVSSGIDAFNILYASVETMVPALYNSVPVPDIRRRFNDKDAAAKLGSQMLERAISYMVDSYDFDHVMESVVRDMEITGRGVTRVRYHPYMRSDEETGEDSVVWEEATCEHVPWANFRHGPGRMWTDVQWVGFEQFYTREQLREINPKLGDKVRLDVQMPEYEQGDPGAPPPEIFQRARVYEIWDKEKRQVVFVAASMAEEPLKVEDDPLGMLDFFPVPRPLYAIKTSDSLIPIPPYRMFRKQAQELAEVTQRIVKLIRCLKWKGVRDGSIKEFEDLAKLDDGQFSPMMDTAALYSQAGGIDRAIWIMPIDKLIATIRELAAHREEVKQSIFEVTGVADIMRGQTDPNETKGAQQMKVQWGTIRIQRKQQEVARFARDLFRLKSEIIGNKFSEETLMTMTGIQLPTAQEKAQAEQLQQMQMMMAQAQQQGAPQGGPRPNGARPPMPPPSAPQRPPQAPQGAY